LGKNHYLKKNEEFYRWALYIFSFLFGLIMCYELQTWSPMAIEKMYVIYFMHIDFIQSSSSNHWIKLNFDSKWTSSFNCCHAHSKLFFLCLRFSKDAIKISTYNIPIILVINHIFWVKSGEKWFTYGVLSPTSL